METKIPIGFFNVWMTLCLGFVLDICITWKIQVKCLSVNMMDVKIYSMIFSVLSVKKFEDYDIYYVFIFLWIKVKVYIIRYSYFVRIFFELCMRLVGSAFVIFAVTKTSIKFQYGTEIWRKFSSFQMTLCDNQSRRNFGKIHHDNLDQYMIKAFVSSQIFQFPFSRKSVYFSCHEIDCNLPKNTLKLSLSSCKFMSVYIISRKNCFIL